DLDGSGRPKRGQPGPAGPANSEISYGDDGLEDGYTPLIRPKNLHEIMGPQEAPIEESQFGNQHSDRGFRGGRGRGRGRGHDRGGRGRDRGRGAGRQRYGGDHRRHSPEYNEPATYRSSSTELQSQYPFQHQ